MCITNDKEDFITELIVDKDKSTISGIGSKLRIEGKGTVEWSVTNITGKLHHFHLPAYYVPKSPAKLLSTSIFCAAFPSYIMQVKANVGLSKDVTTTMRALTYMSVKKPIFLRLGVTKLMV